MAGLYKRRATGDDDERRATNDERRTAGDERRAMGDERRATTRGTQKGPARMCSPAHW
jgi:hypothetical protein